MKIILKLLVVVAILYLSPLEAKHLKSFKNSVSMKFVKIPSGGYMMGTPIPAKKCPKDNPFTKQDEHAICLKKAKKIKNSVDKSETPSHKVTLQSFYMQTTEVTQKQWYDVMGSNPAYFKNGNPNMPIESVSYNDVVLFIKKLNEKEHTTKYNFQQKRSGSMSQEPEAQPNGLLAMMSQSLANMHGLQTTPKIPLIQ